MMGVNSTTITPPKVLVVLLVYAVFINNYKRKRRGYFKNSSFRFDAINSVLLTSLALTQKIGNKSFVYFLFLFFFIFFPSNLFLLKLVKQSSYKR